MQNLSLLFTMDGLQWQVSENGETTEERGFFLTEETPPYLLEEELDKILQQNQWKEIKIFSALNHFSLMPEGFSEHEMGQKIISYNAEIDPENEELMLEACSRSEKAVIIVSLHLGGFEAGSVMRNIRKFYAVFRRQKNRKLNDLMTKWREEGGLNSLPLKDTDALNKALGEKCMIALASDHHGSGVEIQFFGRPVEAVTGPALLGFKNKTPLILTYAVFEDNVIKIKNKKILEIEKKGKLKETMQYNMQKIFHEFEEIIREYPDQYMWQHKRWRKK